MKTYILAHLDEPVEEHAEDIAAQPSQDVAEISPAYLVGGLVTLVVIVFVVWKFLIKK